MAALSSALRAGKWASGAGERAEPVMGCPWDTRCVALRCDCDACELGWTRCNGPSWECTAVQTSIVVVTSRPRRL